MRKALDYTYDFEKINVYKQCKHANSLFSNSDFAANGMPGPGELAILEPFRKDLPPEVFGPAYVPPRTDHRRNALRENLKKARKLLEEAGWKMAPTACCATPRASRSRSSTWRRRSAPGQRRNVFWARNLAKLGIKFKLAAVDFALYRKRLETFDFDMVSIRTPDFTIPTWPN